MFIWLAIHKALSTSDYLSRKRIIPNNTCQWCLLAGEDIEHLFWLCPLTKSCWDIITNWFNIDALPRFNTLLDAIKFFNAISASQGGGTCLIAMLWTLWLTGNEYIFRNSRIPKSTIEKLIKIRAWEWSLVGSQISTSHQQ